VKFSDAIDTYIEDMRVQGRLNSPSSERGYRGTLNKFCEDVLNRDPRYIGRDDVKRTLARWKHPNSQRKHRAVLVSFFDWTMEEGLRKDNPARQTRRPKRRPVRVYRMTRTEASAFLAAAVTTREKRISHLGICAGIRNAELRGLQGRHFQRPGWIWISGEIAKGGRERWIPVLPELAPVVADIVAHVADDEYVIPAQRWRDPGANRVRGELAKRPSSSQALRTLVMDLAKRAGIHAHIHPHLMRHAFGDHVARYAGIKNAQALLGHADVGTTQAYTGAPTLDEWEAAIRGFRFASPGAGRENVAAMDPAALVPGPTGFEPPASAKDDHTFYPPQTVPAIPLEAPTGIEPVGAPSHGLEPNIADWLLSMQPTIEIYADAFGRSDR